MKRGDEVIIVKAANDRLMNQKAIVINNMGGAVEICLLEPVYIDRPMGVVRTFIVPKDFIQLVQNEITDEELYDFNKYIHDYFEKRSDNKWDYGIIN